MRASRAALLLGGWLAVAASSCTEAAPSGGPPAPAAPPPPRFWLVDTKLAAEPGAAPTRSIQGPVLIELLPGGKVRSVPEAREAFEGFIPEAMMKTPADRRGLMLHGQRVSELHLDSPAGPVIGRIHPGAFVSIAPQDDGATWLVAVPRYSESSGEGHPLLAYVDRSALGPAPQKQVPPVLAGKVSRDFGLPLWADDLSRVLVNRLLCGDFYITGEDGRERASQYHDGIEVSGRLDVWTWRDRGESACLGRMVFQRGERLQEARGKDWLDAAAIEAVPEGYRRLDLPEKDPLAAVIERRASVFWLVQTKRGLECHEWRVTQSSARKGATPAVLEGQLRRQRDPIHAYFRFDYGPSPGGPVRGDLSLWGPYFTGGGYKCGRPFSLVGADTDLLYVDNPKLRTDPPGEWKLVAYHPDDVEHWFLGREACETARGRAVDTLARDPGAADHLGLHFDCFDELYR